jgi:hypothetical protein
MSDAFQFQSRTADDGSLNLHLQLGRAEASKDVLVTVQPLIVPTSRTESWTQFVARTYGSCADLARPDQGSYEQRESLE